MTIAVPVILAVALATSLYSQVGTNWPNYQSEQNDKSDQSSDDSSKDKSDKASSDKSKSAQKDTSGKPGGAFGKSSKAAASKGRQDAAPKRQE
jgi:hypothetical protein